MGDNGGFYWVDNYADVGSCMELSATYDDSLKKDETFTAYAIMLAQQIVQEKAVISWGKWGARIECKKNDELSRYDIEILARKITNHPSWTGFKLSTHVFTYGIESR